MSWDDDEDDDFEREGEASDDDPTMPCPRCGEAVYDDAERCPHCGQYLSAEDAPSARPPVWIVVGALAALAGMLWWVLQP
jgi:hypothetical protein